MVVVAMLLTGFSFTSCDENDNAIIIDGKEWVKADVIKTDGGATIVANTPSDVSRMLMKIAVDLNDAVQAGEDYVITIDAPSLESSEGDHTISIPLYDYLTADPTSTAKVVVNFTNAISTDAPLVLQAKGATGGPSFSPENKVELNIPSSSSGLDLELYMPLSSVTLNAGNIDELISTTAMNTLNIESGVTVNWLLNKGGRIFVKDGGKINGSLALSDESYVSADKNGIDPGWVNFGEGDLPIIYYLDGNTEKPYYTQKLKVIKGEKKFANVDVHNGLGDYDFEMYIVDCGVRFNQWGDMKEGIEYPAKIKLIKGEGDAKLFCSYYDSRWDYTNSTWLKWGYVNLGVVKELSNITVDLSMRPKYDYSGSEPEYVEDDLDGSTISLPLMSTDCTFKSSEIEFLNNNKNANSATVSNCKFECFGENPAIQTSIVNFVNDHSSFNFIFDECEFVDKVLVHSIFDQTALWYDENNNQVPAYWWYPLDENGAIINYDWYKASKDLADVPDANKANGIGNLYNGGYELRNGVKPTYFKDYKANITFNNTKCDGKLITKDTDFINGVGRGVNDEGKYSTATFFIIDGKTYKPMLDPDTDKYILLVVE